MKPKTAALKALWCCLPAAGRLDCASAMVTFLPIVQRELSVRSRNRMTWRVRLFAACVAMLLAVPMLLSPGATVIGGTGQYFFYLLTGLTLIFCLFEGARQTADSISGERREGTLGLLFLTDLKPSDVILGKLTVTSLNSVYGLLAIFPILGLGLLAGGIAPGEFWRMSLVLLTTMFLSLTIGLWISTRSVSEQKAILATAVTLVSLVGIAPLVDSILGLSKTNTATFALCSPAYASYLAFDTGYRAAPSRFWCSQGLAILLSAGFLAAAARSIAINAVADLRTTTTSVSKNRERATIDDEPIAWLVKRRTILSRALTLIAGIAALASIVRAYEHLTAAATPGPMIVTTQFATIGLTLLFLLLLVYLICDAFSELRRSGTFELLLCTPQQSPEIIRGYWRGLMAVLRWPFILDLTGQLADSLVNWRALGSLGWMAANLVGTLSVWFSVIFAGGWFALSSKTVAQAVGKTLLIGILGPWLAMMIGSPFLMLLGGAFIPGLYHAPWIIANIAIGSWSLRRLKTRFRETAVASITGEKPLSKAKGSGVPQYFGLLRQ